MEANVDLAALALDLITEILDKAGEEMEKEGR
jgi:hypothetical protein